MTFVDYCIATRNYSALSTLNEYNKMFARRDYAQYNSEGKRKLEEERNALADWYRRNRNNKIFFENKDKALEALQGSKLGAHEAARGAHNKYEVERSMGRYHGYDWQKKNLLNLINDGKLKKEPEVSYRLPSYYDDTENYKLDSESIGDKALVGVKNGKRIIF